MSKRKPVAPAESVTPEPGDKNSPLDEAENKEGFDDEGVRAMYKRLARAYEAEPTVPDCGGGVPGDLYEL
jgi:hypothetical protein